ncbi:MAG: SEC-C metal-binding domain-containing protein, partial [Clostridiales bacterium]|nr:SEC-C metal-binding domain-containing protein [Clostridiales bacterium]
ALTARGMEKAERFFGIDDISKQEYSELNHHIQQALKAHALFERDKDYVVQDGKVLIVDEFTGRLMLGRRYSDGLHQALEAKEGVKVERENRTLATITFQNYFRMFRKLAGMTGTAKTEEQEFQAIYDLDVVEIPTNKPLARKDLNDIVYTNQKAKFNAVVNEIVEVHKTGRPILVGTISVEKSEMLSHMLDMRGIKHEVLNAKLHAREAQIVAQAGKYGNVTIATNMAGRGTDILLGGNPDFLARQELLREGMEESMVEEATGHADTDDGEILAARGKYADAYARYKAETDAEHDQVVAVGGLHIIGTERHESRRIDNQLRGRAGRQGDPGSTRFYVSMEDDLMQRFGGERVRDLMQKISPDEDIPIEAGILTKQIETAQKRVESYNFDIRKNVLQYDDVMNRQREIIYGQRRRVLMGEDIHDSIMEMVDETVSLRCAQFCPGSHPSSEWDMEGLRTEILNITAMDCGRDIAGITDAEKLQSAVKDFAHKAYRLKEDGLMQAAAQLGVDADMRELERVVLLRAVDEHWMDHIDAMDQLRQGISLQAIGQKDPVIAYRNAGFDMFDEMVQGIRERTVRNLYHVVISAGAPQRQQVAKPVETKGDAPARPKRIEGKISRNAPCPCGSGKKYKQCCGKDK